MLRTLVNGRMLWIVVAPLLIPLTVTAADHLLSWNEGAAKSSVMAFVDRVTKDGGADFVPVPQRIATFDNDGTLWAEQPMYFQLLFALALVKPPNRDREASAIRVRPPATVGAAKLVPATLNE